MRQIFCIGVAALAFAACAEKREEAPTAAAEKKIAQPAPVDSAALNAARLDDVLAAQPDEEKARYA